MRTSTASSGACPPGTDLDPLSIKTAEAAHTVRYLCSLALCSPHMRALRCGTAVPGREEVMARVHRHMSASTQHTQSMHTADTQSLRHGLACVRTRMGAAEQAAAAAA